MTENFFFAEDETAGQGYKDIIQKAVDDVFAPLFSKDAHWLSDTVGYHCAFDGAVNSIRD